MNYEQSNVGTYSVPCKKNCRCDECTIERLTKERDQLREVIQSMASAATQMHNAIERLTTGLRNAKEQHELCEDELREARALLRAVMDNAKERPWERDAQVPRGYIRDIEKALANKQDESLSDKLKRLGYKEIRDAKCVMCEKPINSQVDGLFCSVACQIAANKQGTE